MADDRDFDMPWFPLWATDFVNARTVRTMTPEQVGVYILLLCHEWNDGPLPDDEDELRVLANHADANAVQAVLERCFVSDGDGCWINERLEGVREEQEEKREQKVRAGKASAKARRRKKLERRSSGASTEVQRNTNESESESDTEVRTDSVPNGTGVEPPDGDADVDLLDLDPADTDDWKRLRLAFFDPLRKHVWAGRVPPTNVPVPKGKRWSEANELSIVRNWLRTGTLYADEVEPLFRELRVRLGWTGPASLSWVNTADAAPRLKEVLNEARKKMPPKATGLDLRGVLRAS